MIYMITLGLLLLLSLKGAIGSIRQLAGSGGPRVRYALLAVINFTALSLSLALMFGLYFSQVQ
jgi:hypothetical protein